MNKFDDIDRNPFPGCEREVKPVKKEPVQDKDSDDEDADPASPEAGGTWSAVARMKSMSSTKK